MNDFTFPLPLKQNPNSRPPDLDEMWRDFNRRLAALFGRKGNGSGPGGRKPSGSGNGHGSRIGIVIVIIALAAAWAGSGMFFVRSAQLGVVLQLGQYRQTVGPGAHWNPPWPFGAHRIVEVGSRTLEVDSDSSAPAPGTKGASVITRDGDVFSVRMSVQYQVKQPVDYLFHNTRPDEVIMQAAQAALRAVAGAHSTADLLAQGQTSMPTPPAPASGAAPSQSSVHAQIGAQIVAVIQHSLDINQTGLSVTSVTIEHVQPPSAVQAADTALPAASASGAQAASAPAAATAQSDAQMIADARAYSARVIAQAQADAERFTLMNAQYVKAPREVRERIYSETMQQIYANTAKVFIGSQSGKVELPLGGIVDALHQRAASAADASAAPASVPYAASASNAPLPSRSRDALRERARETDLP